MKDYNIAKIIQNLGEQLFVKLNLYEIQYNMFYQMNKESIDN